MFIDDYDEFHEDDDRDFQSETDRIQGLVDRYGEYDDDDDDNAYEAFDNYFRGDLEINDDDDDDDDYGAQEVFQGTP